MVNFVNATSGTAAGIQGNLSISSSGNNRILIVWVIGINAAAFVSGITCDGNAMTLIRNSGGFSGWALTTYYILGQASGTNAIQVNWSMDSGSRFSMLAHSYNGAKGIDGTGAAVGGQPLSSSIITTLAGTWITSAFGTTGSGITSPSGYSTRISEFQNLSLLSAASADSNGAVSAGSHTLTWNATGGNGGTTIIGISEAPSSDNGLFMVSD